MEIITEKIKIGDILFSKKNNCKVLADSDQLVIQCVWFDEQNKLHRELLEIEDLTIIPDES